MSYQDERMADLPKEHREQLAMIPIAEDRVRSGRAVLTQLKLGFAPASWFTVSGNLDAAELRITEARKFLEEATPFLEKQDADQADIRIDTARWRLEQAMTYAESLADRYENLDTLVDALESELPRVAMLIMSVMQHHGSLAASGGFSGAEDMFSYAEMETKKDRPDFILIAKLLGRAEAEVGRVLAAIKDDLGARERDEARLKAMQRDAGIEIKLLHRYLKDHSVGLPDGSWSHHSRSNTSLELSKFGAPQQTLVEQIRYAEEALRFARRGMAELAPLDPGYKPGRGRTKLGWALAHLHGGDLAEPDSCH